MPPISPSGSRTAQLTWLVVFAVLWATASIMAIVFYVNADKDRTALETFRKRYNEVVAEGDLAGSAVAELREAKQNAPEGSSINPSMSLLQVALAERDELAALVGGPQATIGTATDKAKTSLAAAAGAGKQANLTIPTNDNMALAITTLSNGLEGQIKQTKTLETQLKQSSDEKKQLVQQFQTFQQEMSKNLADVRAQQQQATAAFGIYQQSKDQSVGQIEASFATERKQLQDALNNAQVQVAELNRQLTQSQQKIDTLQNKFAPRRVNTEDPVVRHADGKIVRIPGKDIVFIDLGSADSITPGLTFEVYDKTEGIPPAGDPSNDDNLPQGKASIEVLQVGAGNSECRVTRQTPGTQLTEGDLIANLVYDKNTRYNFMVYGEFDMDRNGVATPGDAEIVKRLITQWGGKLMDKVNVDTDFVVLGKEPVLPSFSKEELQDPFNAKKLADAQAALDAYLNVRKTAADLHIPILNQNRFLSLIGYYDQAKR
jgi:hypothetical protein